MCKTCANNVQMLLKTQTIEHILCATARHLPTLTVKKHHLSTINPQLLTPWFSTTKTVLSPLFTNMFSPLYTGPITNTTT